MADDGEERFVGLGSFPKVPEYEPDIENKQSQWVRYGIPYVNVMTRDGWQLAKSEHNASANGPMMHGMGGNGSGEMLPRATRTRVPEQIVMRISHAPGCFQLPLKVKKQIKPNFKVVVAIAYAAKAGVSFFCRVKAHVISEAERHDLTNWKQSAEPGGEELIVGTTSVSHVFDDDPERLEPSIGDKEDQSSRLKFLQHTFEFTGMKITKPSRMKKVYMAFSCTIMERDLLFSVYHVPTIVIAHITNQGSRALNALLGNSEKNQPDDRDDADSDGQTEDPHSGEAAGPQRWRQYSEYEPHFPGGMPFPHAAPLSSPMQSNAVSGSHPGMHNPFDGSRRSDSAGMRGSAMGEPVRMGMLGHFPEGVASVDMGAWNMSRMYQDASASMMERGSEYFPRGPGMGSDVPALCTREALKEYIMHEYDGAGLTRPLTEMDIRSIEEKAGFPNTPEARKSGMRITHDEFLEFQGWFSHLLQLLTRIRTLWNKVEPVTVAGFDIGRIEAMRALEAQQPGTFLLRCPFSNPGSIVISYQSASHQVIHALIQRTELDDRRLDTWVRDCAEAQFLLDIYTGKCVPKSEIFLPEYVRITDKPEHGYQMQKSQPPVAPRHGRVSMPFG
mmetsp:Transcript_40023/g.95103  ORF Transcript_40023/g.95103 Transcript_40023/m.95103 type:complete len:614 (+) Transcript_40023:295-2136(+)